MRDPCRVEARADVEVGDAQWLPVEQHEGDHPSVRVTVGADRAERRQAVGEVEDRDPGGFEP